jgi:hypothetical protein
MTSIPAAACRATVVSACKAFGDPQCHEGMTQTAIARKLAALAGYEFAGEFDRSMRYDMPLYFVPGETICTIDEANKVGIHGEQDFFGGVVPAPVAATKLITHPLVDPAAAAPHGWAPSFPAQVREVVLPGFAAFSADDARRAGIRLLDDGSVRIKKPSGIGGLGQSVVTSRDELEAFLEAMDPEELRRDGLAFERNLTRVTTHSVGQVRVGGLLATYYGSQRATSNNHGAEVYGGSTLTVVRGDFDELLQLDLAPEVRTSVTQARVYHAAAFACFAGMFASRCNYDIAQGYDEREQRLSGVLEQSWRMGGASGAELAALDAFQADPDLRIVRASTTEIYGDAPALPEDAAVYFRGTDRRVGSLTKYSRLEAYGHP